MYYSFLILYYIHLNIYVVLYKLNSTVVSTFILNTTPTYIYIYIAKEALDPNKLTTTYYITVIDKGQRALFTFNYNICDSK